MFKFVAHSFTSRSKELKDSVVGAAKSIAKDARKVTAAASQTLNDDFHSIGEAVASASDRIDQHIKSASEKIDQTVRGTDQERFQAAEEAGKRAENEENKFVLSEHAENPLNKATKMAHETKEHVKDKIHDAKDTVKDTIHDAKNTVKNKIHDAKEKASDVKENVVDETKSVYEKSKDAAIRAQHSTEGYSEPRK